MHSSMNVKKKLCRNVSNDALNEVGDCKRAKGHFEEIYSFKSYNIKLGLTYKPFSKKGLVRV